MTANRGPEYSDGRRESTGGVARSHDYIGYSIGLSPSGASGWEGSGWEGFERTACLRCERRIKMTPWTEVEREDESHCPTCSKGGGKEGVEGNEGVYKGGMDEGERGEKEGVGVGTDQVMLRWRTWTYFNEEVLNELKKDSNFEFPLDVVL